MNKLTLCKYLGIPLSLLFTSNTMAFHDHVHPYVGVEYNNQRLKGNSTFNWEQFFPKKYDNFGVFVGSRFHDNLGVEFGYTQSSGKNKDVDLTDIYNDIFDGQTLDEREFDILKSRLNFKLNSFNLDLNTYLPFKNYFALIATAGFAYTKMKMHGDTQGADVGGINETNEYSDTNRKLIPRLGLGAQYQYNKFGVAIKGIWTRTSRLRIKTKLSLPTSNPTLYKIKNKKAFKDSISTSISIFYKI